MADLSNTPRNEVRNKAKEDPKTSSLDNQTNEV